MVRAGRGRDEDIRIGGKDNLNRHEIKPIYKP